MITYATHCEPRKLFLYPYPSPSPLTLFSSHTPPPLLLSASYPLLLSFSSPPLILCQQISPPQRYNSDKGLTANLKAVDTLSKTK